MYKYRRLQYPNFYIEAINVGITQFVSKPIQFKLLRNAINNTVESVVLEHLLNKSREKELELLKYKDMYNTIQHDATLRKELHIMLIFYKIFPHKRYTLLRNKPDFFFTRNTFIAVMLLYYIVSKQMKIFHSHHFLNLFSIMLILI